MYFDLNVTLPTPALLHQTPHPASSKKDKGKQKAAASPENELLFNALQINEIESRIDVLVHLGYRVFALNQVIQSTFDAKTHVNVLDGLILILKRREGVVYLKRLTVDLNSSSEKGFGFINASQTALLRYDILSLAPSTQATLTACLNCTTPSSTTVHIISIPLTSSRMPFHLKHTTIRSAIKNGALFELNYSPAIASNEVDRRNWWSCARELARVTKGKGLLLSSGSTSPPWDVRGPNDVVNLAALLGIAQNLSTDALSVNPKSLVHRAKTRRTYKSILSEPVLVIPEVDKTSSVPMAVTTSVVVATAVEQTTGDQITTTLSTPKTIGLVQGKKRSIAEVESGVGADTEQSISRPNSPHKKKRKNKQPPSSS